MPSEIKLFNMDCMEAMKQMPDKAFDLAIVDPPYGIRISQELSERGKTCRKNGYREWAYKEWDSSVPSDEYFEQLKRVSKNHIIWGGNYFKLPPSRCWIIWDKGQRDFSFADAELAWTSFEKSIRIFDFSRGKLVQQNKIHPTEKPFDLYRWILKNYATPNDKILDTHVGSGSIAIACYDMGFDLTGYEIDKDYYDAAVNRLENHKKQLTLF
jgi:site-specific DNA-methyltransferase (adenine-specific)